MYGLVFRGLEDLVRQQMGREVWEQIKRQAQVGVEVFVRMDEYPDEMLAHLVATAAEVVCLSPDALLRLLGQHWALYTASEGYGALMAQAGSNFCEMLTGLNTLHERVGQMYPHLQPPQFEVSDAIGDSLVLHYYSHRHGLVPLVVGLLEGLAARWQLQLSIEPQLLRQQGANHDSFLLSWRPVSALVTPISQEMCD